ncbi:methionine biosynthesis protein MetW [Lachnospiraceae bacterium A4]|nr:methionine biosynthesis protein MetW [Lachnospiraceae bacterium A4]
MSKYDFKLELADNTSTGIILKQIDENSTVLEFGCANGRMTKYMKENKKCKVYIVEYDKEAFSDAIEYAEDGICDDIECLSWLVKFEHIKFDYIVFADVLEHLHNPQKILSETEKVLKKSGAVILSVPNVAHGDICLNLYLNQFEYMPFGLLDNTHIHLFAYDELNELCDKAGYGVTIKDATIINVFDTEQGKLIPETYREQLERSIYGKLYTNVYQFIYKLQKKNYIMECGIKEVCNISYAPYGIESFVSHKILGQEQESEKIRVYPSLINKNEYEFLLPIKENTEKIIFEPVSGKGCILTNIKIMSNQGIIRHLEYNGHLYGDSVVFDKMNSEIIIYTDNNYTCFLRVSLKIDLFAGMDNYRIFSDISNTVDNLKYIVEQKDIIISEQNDEINALKVMQKKLLSDISALGQDVNKKNGEYIEKVNQIKFLRSYTNRRELDKRYELEEKDRYINYLESIIAGLKNNICNMVRQELKLEKKCEQIDSSYSIFEQRIHIEYNEAVLIGNKQNCLNSDIPKYIFNNDKYYEIPLLERINKKIAVHLHLFYEDLLPEFFNYLNNIPYVFDLYVSCRDSADIESIISKFSKLRFVNDIIVRKTENRGRDIAPFYVLFNKEIKTHDYVLHIHSKKSLYVGKEQVSWRKSMLNQLLGTEQIVKRIFSLFEGDNDIGLIFMENTSIVFWAQDWLANRELGIRLCKEYNIEFDDGLFNYPVGSFFWAKVDALMPIFQKNMDYSAFPEEIGQTDGTLAHALERFIAFLVRSQGYNLAIIDNLNNTVRINHSNKAYSNYFELTSEDAYKYLKQFDIISFDIFDTLITRKIYRPDDLFKVIGQKVNNILNMNIDFYGIRKKAEQEVWDEADSETNIHKIYLKFAQLAQIELADAEKIKNIEIETEYEFVIPRRDMRKVFNKLRDNGKRIVLVSDMYLTSDIIEKMLIKCGYSGYHDIWVSCEKKARKDKGDIWELFFKTYNQENIVHVGDNLRSDIQILSDSGKNTFYVMSPITQFKLSNQYEYIKPFDNNDLSFSIIMGMVINDKIYNSPFAINKDGKCKISSEHSVGFIAFGALMTTFMQWIANKSGGNQQLLFLAREGYALKQLFDVYCQKENISIESSYLLTSRRCASMASIRNFDDIINVLEQNYTGTLKDLLNFRLGLKFDDDDFANIEVNMPANVYSVMDFIDNKLNYIYAQAEEERRAYLAYLKNILKKNKGWVVVDIGYAGSIQYFLAKVLQQKIDGLYLCTGNNVKPPDIGCKCDQIYNYTKDKGFSDVQEKSLFLEAALQAPFGQLIRFEFDERKQISPVYKNEKLMGKKIEELQRGINDFLCSYLDLTKDVITGENIDSCFASELFKQYTESDTVDEEIFEIFEIQDDYCVKGMLKAK